MAPLRTSHGVNAGLSMSIDQEICAFLNREARYMDEGRYQEWLNLWSDELIYWVPCGGEEADPRTAVSIIYDDRTRLVQRVERLMSGTVLAVEPSLRMRRVVSNIDIISQAEDTVAVESNFMLGVAHRGGPQVWVGRSRHDLRRIAPTDYRIRQKRVDLINADQELPLLQFLI